MRSLLEKGLIRGTVFLASAWAFIFAVLVCTSCGEKSPAFIDLSGEWDISVEDPGSPRVPNFDSARTATIRLPGEWSYVLDKNTNAAATVWLRKKVYIPRGWVRGVPVLYLGRIAVADETSINGVEIGKEGYWPRVPGELDYGFAWQRMRRYYVPSGLLKEGEENQITVRVFSHVLCGMSGKIRIEDGSTWSFSDTASGLIPDIINAAGFVINIVLVIFFTIAMDWKTRKWEVIFACLLLLLVSLAHLIILGLHIGDGLWRYKIMLLIVLGGHFVFLLTVEKFLNIRYRFVNVACGIVLALGSALIVGAQNGHSLVRISGFFTIVSVLAFILYYTSIYFIVLYRDPMRYWPFLLAAVPLVISSGVLSYYVFSGRVYAMPSSISLHLPMALMAVMIVFILDFRSTKNENNSLARTLLKTNWKFNELRSLITRERVREEPREKIYTVIQHLDSNYMEAYERKTLAARFGLNEDYMVQIFKKTTGTTISKYINAKRIDAAKQLLQDTDTKIIDIAYHVGFDNLTHFHRQFKEQTGMTPKEFRITHGPPPQSGTVEGDVTDELGT